MADNLGIMLTELPEATNIGDDDLMYIVQDNNSEKVKVGTLKDSLLGDFYGEASGNPASFADGSASALVECEAEIVPTQDLHGYDKPWAGGAGKNNLPLTVANIKASNTSGTWSGNVYSISNCTFEILTDSDNNVTGIKVNSEGTASQNISFNVGKNLNYTEELILSGCPSGGSNNTYMMYTASPERYDTGNGVTIQYTSVFNAYIYIKSGYAPNNLIFYPMLRLSAEPSGFEPYSNISPISGHSSVNISVMGKNLVNELHNGAIGADGGYTTPTTRVTNATSATSSKIKVTAGKYTISGDGLAYATVITKDDSGNVIDNFAGSWNSLPFTFTITQAANLYFTCRKSDGSENINPETVKVQIEKGETATEIEQYTKITGVPLGQTVYGGQLNVLTGELTVTHILKNITSTDISDNGSTSSLIELYINGTADKKNGQVNMYCNNLEVYASPRVYAIRGRAGSASVTFCLPLSDVPDFNSAKTWVDNNPIQLVYELATPITVQLTPTEIATLLGQNYISSDDTENIDVVYTKSTAPIKPNPSGEPDGYLSSIELSGEKFEIIKELPAFPSSNGNYKLKLSISSGVPTLSWVSDT